MLLGVDDAGLLTLALDEIFGEGVKVSTHAIDQMKDLIADTYQRHEVERIAQRVEQIQIEQADRSKEESKDEVAQSDVDNKSQSTVDSPRHEKKQPQPKAKRKNSL